MRYYFFMQADAKAALSLNGTMQSGRSMVVSIADANRKGQKRDDENAFRAKRAENGKGSQFTQIAPKNARHKKLISVEPPKVKEIVSENEKHNESSITAPSKTQDDFRKLFLGK
jgi:hypothetical protein